jgi:phage terminase large subunit
LEEVIEIDYAPRSVFLPFHERTQRWSAIVAHRRAGKTVACVNDLLKAALLCEKDNGRFAYVAPQYNQAKDIAWGYLKQFAGVVPGVEFNESELRADFPTGARIRLYGADNPDRLRGIYLDGVVLDEYADMRPSVWGEVIRPLLTDRQGWATFIGTPKGHNAFHEIVTLARGEPDWYSVTLKASETELIPKSELDAARKQMSEDQYAQEFECSFEAAIQGAYYGISMRQAEEAKRIGAVPHDPSSEVFTAWDLGIGDSTAIWFAQIVAREIRIIDYYEASGVGIDHYVKVLRDKPYTYGRHFLPHDADASELGTGKSIRESLASLGVRDTSIAPKLSVEEGINAARMLIPRCWFDSVRCKDGLEALKQYRKEYDEKLKAFKQRPLHDWASHGADAFRYLAVSIDRAIAPKALPKIQYRTSGIV